MPLSEFTIRHARTTGKTYTLGDFDGLSLCVTKTGGKLWFFRYYWKGMQKRMSLGTYPEVSLKQARERRDEARRLLAININPCEHRKQQRHEVEIAVKQTFEAVYNEWVGFRRLSLKEGRQSTLSQILRVFKKDILPILGEQPIFADGATAGTVVKGSQLRWSAPDKIGAASTAVDRCSNG